MRYPLDGLLPQPIESSYELIYQNRNIFFAPSQWRQLDTHHIHAIMEVFSEKTCAHSAPHILDRKTSKQRWPRGTPVIASAARLKVAIRHAVSTVKTPSEMLSKMASVVVGMVGIYLLRLYVPRCFPAFMSFRITPAVQLGNLQSIWSLCSRPDIKWRGGGVFSFSGLWQGNCFQHMRLLIQSWVSRESFI
jgi:hypothetical protein